MYHCELCAICLPHFVGYKVKYYYFFYILQHISLYCVNLYLFLFIFMLWERNKHFRIYLPIYLFLSHIHSYLYRMVTGKLCSSRKSFLDELVEKSKNLKHLSETIDSFVECTSFITDNSEIESVVSTLRNFDKNVQHIQNYFDTLNSGLYDLSKEDDILPCASQDPNSCIETETFKEKKDLSCRIVTRTRIYVENPVFMESALAIADNEKTYLEASKFLRKQFQAVLKLLQKYFPEEEDQFPSPGEGLTCKEVEMFEKIRMPLVHILDYFISKLTHKRLSNVEFHDGVYQMFKDINSHYDRLFRKTCWEDKGWLAMVEGTDKL